MTTKSKNQFSSLSHEDQNLILELCAAHEYSAVVEILRKPRAEGGLALHTSRAALCRFFTQHRADPAHALLAQLAAATNIRHEQNSNAFLGAIRANVEARILESLQKGKALADMEKEFRFLKTVENLYLADARFRAEHPKAATAAYHAHIQSCADAPEDDFVRAEDLQATAVSHETSEFDRAVSQLRKRQQDLTAIFQAACLTPDPADFEAAKCPAIPPNSTNFSALETLLAGVASPAL